MSIILVPNDFPTIQEAVITSMPGDLILVKKGTYYESVDVVGKNNIAIIAENGAILDGQNQLPFGFRIGQANGRGSFGIEIKGFIIRKYKEYGIRDDYSNKTYLVKNTITKIGIDGILVEDSGQGDIHLLWKNKIQKVKNHGININATIDPVSAIENKIMKTGNNGIRTLSPSGILYHNIIKNTLNEGIIAMGASVLKNKISYSKTNGISIHGSAVFVSKNECKSNCEKGLDVACTNGFIDGNSLEKNRKDGLLVNKPNNFIINNKVIDNEQNGISIQSNENDVFENLAFRNGVKDIQAEGENNSFQIIDDEPDISSP